MLLSLRSTALASNQYVRCWRYSEVVIPMCDVRSWGKSEAVSGGTNRRDWPAADNAKPTSLTRSASNVARCSPSAPVRPI